MRYSVVNGRALIVLNTLRDYGRGAAVLRLSNTTMRLTFGLSPYAGNIIRLKRGIVHCHDYGIIYGNTYIGHKTSGVIVRLWRVNRNATTCLIFTSYRWPKRRVASRI